MSFEWTLERLGDNCLKIGSGSTPTGGKDAYLEHGPFTLIRSQNIYNDGFTPSGLAFIGEAQAKKLNGVSVESNDVLLNITGDSVARVCLAPSRYLPARVNQHVAIIRPNIQSFDSRYLRYFLTSPQQQDLMLGLASAGATRPALTKAMIENFKIPCPPIKVQQSIADMLSSLDDRIALLRETNATLEAIAQAMFKSWFVDFDPVHAKQQGRAPEGMDEATAALFPDSFEESELGLVPKGWNIVKLDEICELQRGLSYKGDGLSENKGAYMFNLGCFNAPRVFATEKIKRYTGPYKVHHSVKAGDLIIANTDMTQDRAILGRPLVIPKGYDSGFVSHHVYKVEQKKLYSINLTSYLFFSFLHPAFRDVAVGYATGTTVLALPKEALHKHRLIMAGAELISKFTEITSSIFTTIELNIEKADSLATLRDSLLPRLISGQLRLPENELSLEALN